MNGTAVAVLASDTIEATRLDFMAIFFEIYSLRGYITVLFPIGSNAAIPYLSTGLRLSRSS